MKIVVFGAGGVGGYYGGLLACAGHQVTFIARGQHLEAMRAKGLKVLSVHGDFLLHPAHVTNKPDEIGRADYIVVAVKHFHLLEAAKLMKPLIGPGSTVLPLLNGVDSHQVLTSIHGPEPVVVGLTNIVSRIEAPGVIRQESQFRRVVAGEMDGRKSSRVQNLLDVWAEWGVETSQPEDIYAHLWTKFLFLASYAGISSLAGVTSGELLSCPETQSLLERAMIEIRELAHRRQIPLDTDVVENALLMLERFESTTTSSMQRDVAAGKPFELEALSGTVVRLGRESQLPTPIHAAIYALLLPLLRRVMV